MKRKLFRLLLVHDYALRSQLFDINQLKILLFYITEIDSESAHSSFPHLKFLNLNNTLLATWEDIEKLTRFPALRCLRVLGCPIFDVRTLKCYSDLLYMHLFIGMTTAQILGLQQILYNINKIFYVNLLLEKIL